MDEQKTRITKTELAEETALILKDEFVAVIEQDETNLSITFPHGQSFCLFISEKK